MGIFDKFKKNEEEDYSMDAPNLPPLPPRPIQPPAAPQKDLPAPSLPTAPKVPPLPPTAPSIPSPEPKMNPSFNMPRPVSPGEVMPKPMPTPVEPPKQVMPEIEEPPKPEIKAMKPEVFIKIDKYRSIMKNVDSIKDELAELQEDLKELERLDAEEKSKIESSKAVADKINKMILFLDETFTSTE